MMRWLPWLALLAGCSLPRTGLGAQGMDAQPFDTGVPDAVREDTGSGCVDVSAIVDYSFPRPADGDNTVPDEATADPPVPLAIEDRTPVGVEFVSDGVTFLETTRGGHLGASLEDSRKLGQVLLAANQFSVVVWISSNNTVTAPTGTVARIVTLSLAEQHRSFVIGQTNDRLVARVRTSATNTQGSGWATSRAGRPDISLTDFFPTNGMRQVVLTYSGTYGELRVYVDGVLRESTVHGGDAGVVSLNWNTTEYLGMGSDFGIDRPWYGTAHRTSVFPVALSDAQITCLAERGARP